MNDDTNPVQFATNAIALAVIAWYAGRFVERTVGSKGMLFRFVLNVAVLYAAHMFLPAAADDGSALWMALPTAVFFNTQTWTGKRLV